MSQMKREPITAAGAQRLREELERLKRVDRNRIKKAIQEARAHGDLKENAEYHAAKEEQGFIEGRISTLEALLSRAEVIDVSKLNVGDKVVFGATVELETEDGDQTVTYQIVGDAEADIEQGLISVSSPIARALIGKEVDDEVKVHAPGGVQTYYILSIKYE